MFTKAPPRNATLAAASAAPALRRAMALDVESLYRRYGDMVLGRCRALLRDEADAQEVCQEIFLKIHRYSGRFRGEASPTTYLFRVTTTTCLNRLRTRRRRPEDPVEEPPTVAVHDSGMAAHAVRDLVGRLLETADEKTQSCLIYHYVDGMTHREIGDIMGLSAAAVRKRIGKFKAGVRDNPPEWLREAR